MEERFGVQHTGTGSPDEPVDNGSHEAATARSEEAAEAVIP
jgi:hypothetical protein